MGISRAHEHILPAIGHGTVALVRDVAGHAAGDHILSALCLKQSRSLPSEGRGHVGIAAGNFRVRVEEIFRQGHTQHGFMVCIKVEIALAGFCIRDHIKVACFVTAGVVEILHHFIGAKQII